jgi:hypothetical protein
VLLAYAGIVRFMLAQEHRGHSPDLRPPRPRQLQPRPRRPRRRLSPKPPSSRREPDRRGGRQEPRGIRASIGQELLDRARAWKYRGLGLPGAVADPPDRGGGDVRWPTARAALARAAPGRAGRAGWGIQAGRRGLGTAVAGPQGDQRGRLMAQPDIRTVRLPAPARADRTTGTCHASLRPGCQPVRRCSGVKVAQVSRMRSWLRPHPEH